MDNYDIVIFGAGIAGLTVAHELLKNSSTIKIAIIEKENIIGGMARSSRYPNNIPTEHSWRGYAPFYTNTFELMKEIPFKNKTVLDNLNPDINFINVENNVNPNKEITFYDYYILIYWILYYLFSGNLRQEDNKTLSFNDLVKSQISLNAHNRYIESIGPGIGLDSYSASLFHIGKFAEMTLFNQNYDISPRNNNNWNFTNQPTSEAWFDPWFDLLKNKVDFYLSSELTELIFNEDKAILAKLKNNTISGKNYVIAMNPYAVADLYKNKKLGNDAELEKFIKITYGEPHIQISFRLAFNDKINISNKDAFIFPNSNLNITMYPQDNFWDSDINLGDNIKSLWSGTACVTYKMSELYNKRCDELTKEEFLNEVIHEISNSKEFDNYLLEHNNKRFSDLKIATKEIWYEWEYIDNRLQSRNKKWVNTISNNNRPKYTTHYNNVFIAGAHCDTNFSIWSMESAVESGRRCAIEIIKKLGLKNNINLYTHSRPFKVIYFLDDILYKLKLPNLFNLIVFIVIFGIVYIFVNFIKNHSEIKLG